MEWLQNNWLTIAIILYAAFSEIVGMSPLKSNSVVQLIMSIFARIVGKGKIAALIVLCFLLLSSLFLLLALSARAASVTLAWDASSGAAGYKLYYRTTPTGAYTSITNVGNVLQYTYASLPDGLTGSSKPTNLRFPASMSVGSGAMAVNWDAPTVTGGITYIFAATAYDSNGLESDYSNTVSYSTSPQAITGYRVEYQFTGDTAWKTINTALTREALITGMAGRATTVRVVAYGASGDIAISDTWTVTPPAKVTGLKQQ